jgi:hypothetical protein
MKRILIRLFLALVVLLGVAILAAALFLDRAIKHGIETFGPKLTRVEVKLDKASLSLFSGAGAIQGLVIGNPEGFKTPQAISIGSASLAVKAGSLLSDKVVIRSIQLDAPDITLEVGLGGSNLGKILANVEETTGGTNATAQAAAAGGPGKKLQVDDFKITGAKLQLSTAGMSGKSLAYTLPTMQLKDLGTGPEGITSAELTRRVLTMICEAAFKVARDSGYDVGKMADQLKKDLTKDLDPAAVEQVDKLGKTVGDLLKKKK